MRFSLYLQLFFLIVVLLLVGTAPANLTSILFEGQLSKSILASFILYFGTVSLICWQNRSWKISREFLKILSQIELIASLAVLFFGFGLHRLFFSTAISPFGITLLALFSLLLYFFGVAVSVYSSERRTQDRYYSRRKALKSIFFTIPFTLPFLLFAFVTDIATLFDIAALFDSIGISGEAETLFLFFLSVLGIVIALVFLPPLIVMLWQCKLIDDLALLNRLDHICKRAHFRYAGFKVWSIMEGAFTAAILGVIGRFRYVLFTPQLLRRLSPNAIEAILVHEIGHSHYKHLLFYPFILVGAFVTWAILSMLVFGTTDPEPSIFVFTFFILNIGLYFRFVFGYFSRLFERQADLYVFVLEVDPESLIEALNDSAVACGGTHLVPSWHHFSIQQRIDFIKKVKTDKSLFNYHQYKVRMSLIVYFVLLILSVLFLI